MLLLASLAVFLSGPAQTYGVSVFIDPILADFGWSRSLISTLYSIATLAGAIPMILIGRQIDRVGNRLIMTIAALLFGLSLLWLSVVSGPVFVLLGLAILRTFGSGVLTLGARTLVPHWYVRRRGWAFSMLGISGSISLAVVPRFNEALISWVGWRHAWQIIAAITLVGLTPVLGALIRNRPEDVGEKPDGVHTGKRLRRPSLLVDAEDDWTVREAMTTRMFWAMLLAGTVPAVVLTGISFHQTSLLTARDLSPGLAASVFAAESMVALPITLAAGWVVDRYPIRYTLAAAQLALLVALIALLAADSVPLALLYGGLRGISTGLWAVSADVAWTSFFGKKYLGSIRGVTFAVGTVGAAIGPVPLGLVYDATSSYSGAIIAYMVLPLIALAVLMTAGIPVKSADVRRQTSDALPTLIADN
jgi:MFS family permease